mmetsp:Transcript_12818/g.19420  ORF Transcript_12818/g.19420 Transcript_12818/m.19420 type:complete len:477 (-) Transcript_12818:10-1440(-)
MEDRHSLSAPRYIGDLQWEVDVFRDTVEQPVETLLINSETLPPRTRKGKVVWQLPSDANKLPSFGAEDKRRIFDLFKQVKKQRKKEKAAAAKQQSCGNNKSNAATAPPADDAQSPLLAPINEPSSSSAAKNPELIPVAKPYAVATIAGAANDSKSTTPLKSKKKGKSKSPTPKKKGESSEKQKMKIAAETIIGAEKSNGDASEAVADDVAINALNSSLQDQITLSADERLIPEVSLDKKAETQTPLKQQQQQSQCTTPSMDQRAAINPNNNNAPTAGAAAAQLPPVRFRRAFVTNPAEVGSLSVSAAKQFVDRYYTSVQQGISLELACHYTEKAQKSVSVGNAHSVVTGYESIALQLASFRGATFTMRGVVAQDTPDGGAHLLVTGMMIPAEGAGLPSSFAHSVVLTPAFVEPGGDIALAIQINGGGKPFQIHNDAFALISSELPIARPRPPPPTGASFASPMQSSPAFTRPPGFH